MAMANYGMHADEIKKAARLGFTDARFAFDAFSGRSVSNQSRKGITSAEHQTFGAWLDEQIAAKEAGNV